MDRGKNLLSRLFCYRAGPPRNGFPEEINLVLDVESVELLKLLSHRAENRLLFRFRYPFDLIRRGREPLVPHVIPQLHRIEERLLVLRDPATFVVRSEMKNLGDHGRGG